ncbi:MAG: BrnT family toxin [Alkalinema sp. CAN_BIN05]|nr:BrnT family toxin [Alkalinema sp. CAN_BIN05]
MKFDWNPIKAERNETKHNVSFQEAASVFDDPLSITFPDPAHSIEEERTIIIGQSKNGRLLFVSHLDRNNITRIISAREVTRSEKRIYEEEFL